MPENENNNKHDNEITKFDFKFYQLYYYLSKYIEGFLKKFCFFKVNILKAIRKKFVFQSKFYPVQTGKIYNLLIYQNYNRMAGTSSGSKGTGRNRKYRMS